MASPQISLSWNLQSLSALLINHHQSLEHSHSIPLSLPWSDSPDLQYLWCCRHNIKGWTVEAASILTSKDIACHSYWAVVATDEEKNTISLICTTLWQIQERGPAFKNFWPFNGLWHLGPVSLVVCPKLREWPWCPGPPPGSITATWFSLVFYINYKISEVICTVSCTFCHQNLQETVSLGIIWSQNS